MIVYFYKNIKTHQLLVCLFLMVLCGCKKDKATTNISPIKQYQSTYLKHLNASINYLDTIVSSTSKTKFKENYVKARQHFKHIEAVFAFVDKENYKTINAPNILKIEEEDATDIKINNPFGFQVIEETVYEDTIDTVQLKKIVLKTKNRLQLIAENTNLRLKDYHVLWVIRDQIARIALTSISGFDSPVLQSLKESSLAYQGVLDVLEVFEGKFKSKTVYQDFKSEIEASQNLLNSSDFETFDRYSFIKNHAHKQLELLQAIKKDWSVDFPLELAFNNDMTSLFSNTTFNLDFFADLPHADTLQLQKQQLGKVLFNDTRLSKDNSMSCASCHHKDKAFTDGLKVFPNQKRNSPTLLYAAYQQSFFYDGRTGNLEGQIVDVVNNKAEFHSDLDNLTKVIKTDSTYVNTFNTLFRDGVNQQNIRNSIAAYVRSLGDFNSKFDLNINGKENTLTTQEINGFNLFMGKAKCATCHFPPVFNGTVPPIFTETELELLGVPKDTINNVIDTDLGRYNVFNTPQRQHFFKTPTIRNISKTAPYMHNGVYTTLEQVMTFYNNGGGAGLKMDLEYQTLPSDSLQLSNKEIKAVISFMKTLDDR